MPIDREFAAEKQYKVYYDSDSKKPWDAYMTKVDLKNGPYGDYVFYKMQIIFDSNRELYIVLTRYGSIGEHGMHQRTPFNDVEEAKKEFPKMWAQGGGRPMWMGSRAPIPRPSRWSRSCCTRAQ